MPCQQKVVEAGVAGLLLTWLTDHRAVVPAPKEVCLRVMIGTDWTADWTDWPWKGPAQRGAPKPSIPPELELVDT